MATRRANTEKRRKCRNNSSIDSASFFKLIPSKNPIHLLTLRLPGIFANDFGNDLSEVCYLVVPTGESHQVSLVEEDNHLWFRDGWEAFVNRFSIRYGSFITFKYLGRSKFKVTVFDLSTCEIPYPCDGVGPTFSEQFDVCGNDGPGTSRRRNAGGVAVESNSEEDDEMKSADESPTNSDSKMEVDSEDDEMDSQEGTETRYDSENDVHCSVLGAELPSWLKTFQRKLKYVFVAGFPKPANPYFVSVICLYHLSSSGFMHVPIEFARTYLKCEGKEVMIELRDGSQCAVRCVNNKRSCSLSRGWPLAAQRARLEVGNLCFLELIDARNRVLKLHSAKLNLN